MGLKTTICSSSCHWPILANVIFTEWRIYRKGIGWAQRLYGKWFGSVSHLFNRELEYIKLIHSVNTINSINCMINPISTLFFIYCNGNSISENSFSLFLFNIYIIVIQLHWCYSAIPKIHLLNRTIISVQSYICI